MKTGFKKEVLVFAVLFFVLGICVISIQVKAARQPSFTITADKTKLYCGDTVTVTVEMSGNSEAYGIVYELLHDTATLELQSVETMEMEGTVFAGLDSSGFDMGSSDRTYDNTALTTVIRSSAPIADGTVLVAKYKVKEDAQSGQVLFNSKIEAVKEDAEVCEFENVDKTQLEIVELTEEIPVESISLEKGASVLRGQKRTLEVTYQPENATIDRELTWALDNNEVAEVNEATGEITAKKEGNVNITATTKAGIRDFAQVEIQENRWDKGLEEKVTFSESEKNIAVGETADLRSLLNLDKIIKENSITDDITLTWLIDSEEFASIDSNGMLLGIAEGQGVITVTVNAIDGGGVETANFSLTLPVKITVEDQTGTDERPDTDEKPGWTELMERIRTETIRVLQRIVRFLSSFMPYK